MIGNCYNHGTLHMFELLWRSIKPMDTFEMTSVGFDAIIRIIEFNYILLNLNTLGILVFVPNKISTYLKA